MNHRRTQIWPRTGGNAARRHCLRQTARPKRARAPTAARRPGPRARLGSPVGSRQRSTRIELDLPPAVEPVSWAREAPRRRSARGLHPEHWPHRRGGVADNSTDTASRAGGARCPVHTSRRRVARPECRGRPAYGYRHGEESAALRGANRRKLVGKCLATRSWHINISKPGELAFERAILAEPNPVQ